MSAPFARFSSRRAASLLAGTLFLPALPGWAAVSVTGPVGPAVGAGTGKALTWNARADWNGQYSAQLRFEEVADDAPDGFASIPAGAFSMGDSLDGMGDAPVRVDFSGGDTSKKTPVGNS